MNFETALVLILAFVGLVWFVQVEAERRCIVAADVRPRSWRRVIVALVVPGLLVLGLVATHPAQGDGYANTPYGRFPRVSALPTCSTSVNFNKTYVLAGTEVPWHCDGSKYRLLGPALPVTASTGQRVGGQTLNNGDIFMTFTPRLPGTIEQIDATSRGDGSGAGTVNLEFVQGSTVLCTVSAACNIAPNTAISVTVCPANVFADFATAGTIKARYGASSNCNQNPSFQLLGSVLFFLPSP